MTSQVRTGFNAWTCELIRGHGKHDSPGWNGPGVIPRNEDFVWWRRRRQSSNTDNHSNNNNERGDTFVQFPRRDKGATTAMLSITSSGRCHKFKCCALVLHLCIVSIHTRGLPVVVIRKEDDDFWHTPQLALHWNNQRIGRFCFFNVFRIMH